MSAGACHDRILVQAQAIWLRRHARHLAGVGRTLGTVAAMVAVSLYLRLTERHYWALAVCLRSTRRPYSRSSSFAPAARPTATGAGVGATASRAIAKDWSFLEWRFWKIKNLHVAIDGKEILKGLDLAVNAAEVHAIMGPNGSGKSTLAYVLAGKAGYEPTSGEVLFNSKNFFDMTPDERAAAGARSEEQFAGNSRVATMTFLRTALNAQRKTRGEAELSTPEFIRNWFARHPSISASIKRCCEKQSMSDFPAAKRSATRFCRWRFCSRDLPCSTKRILVSTLTHSRSWPRASIAFVGPERSMIVITHYQRLLNFIVPRCGACDGPQRQSGEVWWQGARASARGQGLRPVCPTRQPDERGRARHENAGRAGTQRCFCSAARCGITGQRCNRDPAANRRRHSTPVGCHIVASRNGNTRICARLCARPNPWRSQPSKRRRAGAPPVSRLAASLSSMDATSRIGAISTPAILASCLTELFAFAAEETSYRLGDVPGKDDTAFWLNTAFMTGGVVVRVKKGARVEKPVHLAHLFCERRRGCNVPAVCSDGRSGRPPDTDRKF